MLGVHSVALLLLAFAGGLIAAEAVTGQIKIDCEAGVTITLDGVSACVTTYANGGATLDKVPAGSHRIGVAKAGFKTEEKQVTVEPGKMEVIAVFSFQPNPDVDFKTSALSSNPLKVLADAQSVILERTSRWEAAYAAPMPVFDGNQTEYMTRLLARSDEIGAAGHAYREAVRQLTVVEEAVSGQFRSDYAALQLLNRRTDVSTEQKNSAWRKLASKWNVPTAGEPSLLVWRQHRVVVARGNLRVKVGGEWRAQLGAPKYFIDGREVAPIPNANGGLSVAEFRSLTAGPRILRIEHPAVELAEVTLPVEDGKTVSITWKPKFVSPTPKP